MNHIEQPRSGTDGRMRRRRGGAIRLDGAVEELIDNQISPRQASFDLVSELWSQLLPPELARHCKIAGISGGLLKVIVDSPTYMHELRLCSSELLKGLQQRCLRARIKKIKIVLA